MRIRDWIRRAGEEEKRIVRRTVVHVDDLADDNPESVNIDPRELMTMAGRSL